MAANSPRNYDLAQLIAKENGSPQFLGVITTVSTASQNNHGTAVPFNNTGNGLASKMLMVQPDAACYILQGTTNAVAAVATATSSSILLASGERAIITMAATEGWLAVIGAAAVNLKVWELV